MAKAGASSAKAMDVLTSILLEWPAEYARGGRKSELIKMINRIVSNSLVIIFVLSLFLLPNTVEAVTTASRGALPLEEMPRVRSRREGFGPWEANDAWDNKGKSNFQPMIDKLIEVIKDEGQMIERVLNKTIGIAEEVVEVFEHPIAELRKSYVGLSILGLALLCLVGLAIRFSAPVFKIVWGGVCLFFDYFILPFFRLIVNSTCCMYFCASRPFVALRNRRHRKQMEKESLERMKIYKPSEEVLMLKKTTSAVYTDETGVYLLADDNHRVYLQPERLTEDLLMMKTLGGANRDKGTTIETVKESMLAVSKLYKIDKLPDFQGVFEVDGNLIGHFSRIKFSGMDCLLTAYHVLDYNRTALITLRKGDKCIRFDSVKANVVAASHTDHLDFIILAVPSCVFSTLGMKVGTWTSRVQPREPVQIHQLYEGKPCVSSAAVKISAAKSWHINYAASTNIGTSGAPVVDSKNRIIGVHLEYDAAGKMNVGVIPPVFRMNKKESPTNEDIAQGQPELELYNIYEEPESDEEYDEEFEEMKAYEIYLTKHRDMLEVYETGTSWAEYMDDEDERVAKKMRDKYAEKYEIYRTKSGIEGSHVGAQIKRGHMRKLETPARKESPWTCSQCACVQNKGYCCVNCGFALVPLTKKILRKQEKGAEEAKNFLNTRLPVEMTEKIMTEVNEDAVIKKIALQVVRLLNDSRRPSADVRRAVESGKYPQLPTKKAVPMEKKLVQEMRTLPTNTLTPAFNLSKDGRLKSACLKIDGDTLNTVAHTLLDGHDYLRDGLILVRNPVVKIDPKKETSVADVATELEEKVESTKLTKSAKRRLRDKRKQEIVTIKAETTVPLNSKAPAMSGAPTTSGMMKPSLSLNNQRKLGGATSFLPVQGNGGKPVGGKKPAQGNQSMQSTHGHLAVPKQKSVVSNSNVTSTL
jgi:hypothetical protein